LKRFGAAIALMLVVVLWLVTSSQGGAADKLLPVNGHVKKESSKELRLGFGRVMPWQWTMSALEARSTTSRDRVCFLVGFLGPLVPAPGGGVQGPGTGESKCGPIDPKRGVVVTSPNGAGSIELPSGKTESWQAFDAGIAAYPPFVGHVRLNFLGGGSEVRKTRAVPRNLAFQDAEPFRYIVYAVHGCVSEVEGLAKGRVVAHVGPRDCSDSP
jgi:hypothetical protein